MTDAPSGAPAPQPDLERHPRTKITRLPYIVVVLIALVVAVVWGAVTMQARNTADREIVGIGHDPARAEQAVTNPPQR